MCAIVGCYNTPAAATITRLGMLNVQHRAQEWCGIVSSDGHNFYPERAPFRAPGHVRQALTEGVMSTLMGHMAFGHLRYSTQGASELNNAQPHRAGTADGDIFFASNGDILNCTALRRELREHGFTFYSYNDAEVIVKLIAHRYRECGDMARAIREARRQLIGTYSGVLMMRDRMFLFRDPLENRPFCYTIAPDGAVLFASETSAIDIMTAGYPAFDGKRYRRAEVSRDTILELTNGTIITHDDLQENRKLAHCAFEHVYFLRPDSVGFGLLATETRKRLAERLAMEIDLSEAGFICPVPDSGNVAALALSRVTGIPMEFALVRSHYIGRTFIEHTQTARDSAVREKFNPISELIRGRTIVLVDDSIVRSTTIRQLVSMIRGCEPKKIIVVITAPPIRHPCYYGVDIKDHLIAAVLGGDIEAIKQSIGLRKDEVLHYLSLPGLRSVFPDPENWCYACWNGDYPTSIKDYVRPVD